MICSSCSRRLVARQPQSLLQSYNKTTTTTSLVQTRGKKKNAKPRTSLPVRLLQDLPEYGRKGSIVPVPVGQMRNYYFPNHIADYVAHDELRTLRRNNTPIERDVAFGRLKDARPEIGTPELVKAPRTDLRQLPPDGAYNLLDEVVPLVLDFYRRPIGSRAERTSSRQHLSKQEEAETISPSPESTPRQTPENIFGSVTVADITLAVRALLQQKGLTGLITLPEEDIKFVQLAGTDAETDRIKKLGEFMYEIRVKNVGKVITRQIRVLSEDDAPLESSNKESLSGNAGLGTVSLDDAAPSTEQHVIDRA